MSDYYRQIDEQNIWQIMTAEAGVVAKDFPILASKYQASILNHSSFISALCYCLASKVSDEASAIPDWHQFLLATAAQHSVIEEGAKQDLFCQLKSNASIKDHHTPFLYFGGYHALQVHRFAHALWHDNQRAVASFMQSQSAACFGVDIHPAASIGLGIFIDHAVGIVIGETAVVEEGVTLFQGVTLGGTGKGEGERHPKVRKGAFIGAGAQLFGNIEVGAYAKVAGGAVLVNSVPEHVTVVGSKATIINRSE